LAAENRGDRSFANLVLLTFHGECRAESRSGGPEAGRTRALGATQVAGGRVLPFTEVRCDAVRDALAYLRPEAGAFEKQKALGLAMGRAIAKIDAFEVPSNPKTTFNVGRVGGGTSVNAIPFECWMEVDMRSADPGALKAVDTKFHAALKEAVEEENRRWNHRGAVSVSAELVGVRPAGQTRKDSAIVQSAVAVSRALEIDEVLREGSTDSNVPMNLGIPAITISGGGIGSGAHSLNESFDSRDSWRGTQRVLLLAVVLAR
jgi:acetylornithine deacetylase/succinyl-diaminopimelate desuccinylase-like protein